MKSIILAIAVVAILAAAIFLESCAILPETPVAKSLLPIPTSKPTDPFAGLPYMSPDESEETCHEIVFAVGARSVRCGKPINVASLKNTADFLCNYQPNLKRAEAEFCLQSIQSSACEDEFPQVCEETGIFEGVPRESN